MTQYSHRDSLSTRVTFCNCESSASFTISSSCWSDVKIIPGQWMPVLAMCFPSIFGSETMTVKDVFSLRNYLKMGRINTLSVIARMMQYFPVWYRTYMENVREAMSQVGFCSTDSKVPILSPFTDFPLPLPASIFNWNNFGHEVYAWRFWRRSVHKEILPINCLYVKHLIWGVS